MPEALRFELPPVHSSVAGLFRLLRVSQGYVELSPDALEVRLGWAMSATVPRSSITAAVAEDVPVRRLGANRRGNLWAVVTDGVGLVRLTISPGAPGRLAGFRGTVADLRISLADRDGFLAALGTPGSPRTLAP